MRDILVYNKKNRNKDIIEYMYVYYYKFKK